jgi:hypothetical protein
VSSAKGGGLGFGVTGSVTGQAISQTPTHATAIAAEK